MFGGWSRYPSSRTARPPVASLAGAFAQSLSLYSTRSMGPSRTESTASRSGSSVVRSSLRGHHAPSTYPVGGALGFNRNRGVCSGGVWFRPTSVRSLSWRHRDTPFLAPVRGGSVLCAIFLPTLIADSIVFGDHRPRLRAAILAARPPVNAVLDRHPTATTDRGAHARETSQDDSGSAGQLAAPEHLWCRLGRVRRVVGSVVIGGLYPMVLCHRASQCSDQGQWVGRCRIGSALWAGQSGGDVDDASPQRDPRARRAGHRRARRRRAAGCGRSRRTGSRRSWRRSVPRLSSALWLPVCVDLLRCVVVSVVDAAVNRVR